MDPARGDGGDRVPCHARDHERILRAEGLDGVADLVKFKSKRFSRLVEGAPVVLVERGRPLEHRLRKEHISVEDVLAVARSRQGLLRLDQIDYAILESSGGISIIPAANPTQGDSAGDSAAPPGA